MATKKWQKSNLKLVFSYMNDEGKEVKKSKTYSSLKQNASADHMHEVGYAIASLQDLDLAEVQEVITNKIEQ